MNTTTKNTKYIKMCANVKCIPAHYKLYMIKAELEAIENFFEYYSGLLNSMSAQ